MRIAPGQSIYDKRYLSQPVETGFVQTMNSTPGSTIKLEDATKTKGEVLKGTPTVPVTTLDQKEAYDEALQNGSNLVEAALNSFKIEPTQIPKFSPEVYDTKDDVQPLTQPIQSYFNTRLAPPSIVPSTYPFGKSSSSTNDVLNSLSNDIENTMNDVKEGFDTFLNHKERYHRPHPRSSYGGPLVAKFVWGLTGDDKPESDKNVVESFCSKNWCVVARVIIALFVIVGVLFVISVSLGICYIVKRNNTTTGGKLEFGNMNRRATFKPYKASTQNPFSSSFSNSYSNDSNRFKGGVSASDIQSAASDLNNSDKYSIF